MMKAGSAKVEMPPPSFKGTPVRTTGREDYDRLVAERRTPQTARSARRVGEDPNRLTQLEKCWTTPRRKVAERDNGSENLQTSQTRTKLKPQSLFTPPRHYREEVWPRTASVALSPINVNGSVAGKDGRHGKVVGDICASTPGDRAVSQADDLVPSLSASGRRVQFGSRTKAVKAKELFQADKDSAEEEGSQKRVVWSNPTFCAEGQWENKDVYLQSPYDESGAANMNIPEVVGGTEEEGVFLSLEAFRQLRSYQAKAISKSSLAVDETMSMAAGLSHVARRGSLGASSVSASEGDRSSIIMSAEDLATGPLESEGVRDYADRQQDIDVAFVEADLEADICRNIEEEIANEIRVLSEKLAELHARQGVSYTDREQCPAVALSCPQTPILSGVKDRTAGKVHFFEDSSTEASASGASPIAQSPAKSSNVEASPSVGGGTISQAGETSSGKSRKGRIVSAKFLDWTTKEAGICKSGEKKAATKRTNTPGPFGSSPQPGRRGLSLGGATLITKRREASAHSPHPQSSRKLEPRNFLPSVGAQVVPSPLKRGGQEQNRGHVEDNVGGLKMPSLSHRAATTAGAAKQEKAEAELPVSDVTGNLPSQGGVTSAWQSLAISKRFDWIKTLRSGAQGKSGKVQEDAQTPNGTDDAEVKSRLHAVKASPGMCSIPERNDLQAPRSAGSRIVASRYGTSPVLAAVVTKEKSTDNGRTPDNRSKKEGARSDTGRKPTVRSGYPTPPASSPAAKPLKNENTKSRASLMDAASLANRVTPKGNSSAVQDAPAGLAQPGASSKKPPFSAGKTAIPKSNLAPSSQLTQKYRSQAVTTDGGSLRHGQKAGNGDVFLNSPIPTCDLSSRFEQLAVKKLKKDSSKEKTDISSKEKTDISSKAKPDSSVRQRLTKQSRGSATVSVAPAASSALRSPAQPSRNAQILQTPTKPERRGPQEECLRTPSDFSTEEEFRTPTVLFSPPPTARTTRNDLQPVVTQLRSQLESSPALKKYSDLLKDLDALETERKQLPKIATKTLFGISPRDSGCVKRATEQTSGHPFRSSESQPIAVELSQVDSRALSQNLESLAAQLAVNVSGEWRRSGGGEAINRDDTMQGLLVGCLETYAKEGRWENGALMQHLKEDLLASYAKDTVGFHMSEEVAFGVQQSDDAARKSELETLWLLVDRLDKERRDSVYEMLSQQLSVIQQDQA